MSHIHVCLVSDHLIPNIVPVAQFQPDELFLISTDAMEKKNKSAHIIASLKSMGIDYSSKHQIIQVVEDSIVDCQQKIAEWITEREDADFLVNLTGGTKIMSIATYESFKDYGSKMFYVPIGQTQKMINVFPKRLTSTTTSLTKRLKVADYLAAYGLTIKNSKKLPYLIEEARTRSEHADWIAKHYQDLKNLLFWLGGILRPHRDDKKPFLLQDSFSRASHTEVELLNRLGFKVVGKEIEKELSKSEIQFLTGGWLEEFCFNQLEMICGSEIEDLAISIEISNPVGTSNEFDLMFTSNNKLYTVECKSGDQNDDKKADALYKVAALQKDFGLSVSSFFISTSPHILKDGVLRPSIHARAEQFRTKVITPDNVINFGSIVKNSL